MDPTPTLTPKRESFWRRLWSPEPGAAKNVIDVIFGIAAPILCLIFDPIVFRNSGPCTRGVLSGLATFAYVAIGLGTMALTLWLLTYQRLREPRARAVFAGMFWTGTICASGLGLVMLPWSVFGLLFFGLGLLGFLPFVTAQVYWRNTLRAWRPVASGERAPAPPAPRKALRVMLATLGLALVLGIPAIAQWQSPPAQITPEQAQACAAAE